jgi:class 3 adenylate cyclase
VSEAAAQYHTRPATQVSSRGSSTSHLSEVIAAKYIFLDVVGFTRNRSVEAQTDIIHDLNNIVRGCISAHDVPEEKIIYIPTGDGLCVALLNVESPFDIHVRIALCIIERVQKHNEAAGDELRKFQVRVGINANTDNLVTDINGRPNVTGAGISMAARIMDKADGSQVLVGRSVYDMLRYRERYASSFKSYQTEVKHGVVLDVYQLVAASIGGLNTDPPTFSMVPNPVQFYSCFISYSSKDQSFAERLYTDLQNNGVRCWFAPEDLKIGAEIRASIDESIRVHDKLLLVLSERSVESQWVEQEVETALAREREQGRTVLFPIRLDDAVMVGKAGWSAYLRNTRNIGDFTRWKDYDAYRKAFERLLRDLKAGA